MSHMDGTVNSKPWKLVITTGYVSNVDFTAEKNTRTGGDMLWEYFKAFIAVARNRYQFLLWQILSMKIIASP